MNERIAYLAKRALTGDIYPKPVFYEPENPKGPVDTGKAIGVFLSLQPILFDDKEYLIDRYRFFGMWDVPTCYYRNCYRDRGSYWGEHNYQHPMDFFYWGWTHVALDFDYVLNHGLLGYYKRIEASKKIHAENKEKLAFLEGMKLCLDGIINRYKLYQQKAQELADKEENEERKAALLRIADTLTRIPMHPAESFFDAVQFTWILFLLAADSLGRIDQYLYPFYQKDLQNGVITEAFATELLEELFIKVHESQADNVDLDISGHNHLVVGGYLENGEDGFNDLSKLILEAIAELPTYRPQASFRYTNKTTAETMRYITELNKRCQLIVFVNDEPRIEGMVKCGIKEKDAVNYSVIGCNEWAIVGKSKLDLAHVSLVHALQQAIYEYEPPKTYEAFYERFAKELKKDFQAIIDEYANYATAMAKEENVLTSIFHDDCIENGVTFSTNGTRYYGLTMSFNSISNVADSLSVVKQFVFDEQRVSFHELLAALRNNWQGYEALRAEILEEGRFFGNDDDYVDDIANQVVDTMYDIKNQMQSPYMNTLVIGSFVGATHPNIVLGKRTKATPDGRFLGDAFTMGVSQSMGKDKQGITALLNSIAKLDYTKLCGCLVSNIKIEKNLTKQQETLDRLACLYHTFLELGGMQLQINYLSAEELLDAQKHPEKYQNLKVRVTGYSGYFTRFDRDLQNDIIERTMQK